jgi:hypothetical protein
MGRGCETNIDLPRLFVKIMRDLANEGTDTKLHTTFFKLITGLEYQDYN